MNFRGHALFSKFHDKAVEIISLEFQKKYKKNQKWKHKNCYKTYSFAQKLFL